MTSPLNKGKTLVLPPRFLPSVDYFVLMASYPRVIIDNTMRFDKRDKSVHRCKIADTHGRRILTVPLQKPVTMTGARWNDILISGHDDWWHVHWETLKSAYGRSPFFEYYADDFAPLFSSKSVGLPITDLNFRLGALLRKFLLIESEVTYTLPAGPLTADFIDMRRTEPAPYTSAHPYYQVRSLSQGFIPSLSIVDLLFNLGPEATLYIDKSIGL